MSEKRTKRRRRSEPNRHLFLRNGIWWVRINRHGRDVRESLHVPASEEATARLIRDRKLAQLAEEGAGIERPRDPLLLGELTALYLREESQPFDRSGPVEQAGTKRSSESDRGCVARLFGCKEKRNKSGKVIARARKAHIDPNTSAAKFDREALLDFAKAIEREDPMPAPGTRRKTAAFLRRVFSWAVENRKKTGIARSPFADLTRSDRARLFPGNRKRSYLYSSDELRALYEQLPAHLFPFVRFAVHTGMRFAEITSLKWGAVNLEKKLLTVEARFAKNKRERDVAVGDVALSILEAIRAEEVSPTEHVFLGRRGDPIASVSGGFNAAVSKVWRPSKPGERRPRFHDLRKTAATRIEAVSSHAVAKAFLGHADENVTDTYIVVTLDAVRDAANRAARSIDGDAPQGAIPFPVRGQAERRDGTFDGTPQAAAGK